MALTFDMTEDPSRFDEAVESFASRRVVSRKEADTLEGYARQRVWWVSGVAQMDVANDVHASLLKALDEGVDFEDWKKEIGPKLEAAWGHADGHRILTIYRNATHFAYAAARERQMRDPEVAALRPYHEFVSVEDLAECEICAKCDGVILPIHDPWWDGHSPLMHHACRCQKRSLRAKTALAKGITQVPPEVDAGEGFGVRSDLSEVPKPVERKTPPGPVIHRELYLKKERDAKRRKPKAIPEKLVATNEDAEIFSHLRKTPDGLTIDESNRLAEARIAALQRLPDKLDRKRARELIVATGADVPVEAAMEHPKLVAALGDKFHIDGWEHKDLGEKLQKEVRGLAKLNPELVARVTHFRHDEFIVEYEGVFIGAKKLTELDGLGRLAGVTPRGWDPGQTWDEVKGAGGPQHCVVAVAGTKGGSASTIRHEFGHSMGARTIIGGLSLDDSPDLIRHHERLFSKLTPYQQQGGPGGRAGRQETLAESIAELYSYSPEYFDDLYDTEYREWLSKILGKQ